MNTNKDIEKFLNTAKSHRDSGFCGGCTYIENNLENFLLSQFKEVEEEVRKFLADKVDWILTPHAYESDDPKMEKFALGLKEKYKKEILQTLEDKQDV